MNALDLIDDALNLRTPTVYDEITVGNDTTRVVNEAETIAAACAKPAVFPALGWTEANRGAKLAADASAISRDQKALPRNYPVFPAR